MDTFFLDEADLFVLVDFELELGFLVDEEVIRLRERSSVATRERDTESRRGLTKSSEKWLGK